MRRFRKKAVLVEAGRWFKEGDVEEAHIVAADDLINRSAKRIVCSKCGFSMSKHGILQKLGERCTVCPGDWIVKDEKCEFRVMSPDEFEKNYETFAYEVKSSE